MDELGRLEALRLAGLTAAADPGMDRFARMVARSLHVPVSLVSILESDRQVFPGMVGLEEPWASQRQTPLSHSFCQHVVASGEPLILNDSRLYRLTCASLAIPDLRVIAYAGMPLTDADGHVLGSLCAIGHEPREWTEDELRDLEDLAAACSVELRLRIATEQIRRDRDHAAVLLRASVELGRSRELTDLLRRLRRLFAGPAEPSYVGLLLADERGLFRVADPDDLRPVEADIDRLERDAGFPSAQAMREQRTVFVPDHAALADGFCPEAVAGYDSLGLSSVLCVPLARGRGVLMWCWAEAHVLTVTEEAVLTAVAGYASQAVERTLFVENRLSAAEQLQSAMLTALPVVPGLEMAALYLPAADQDMVGGDWYDAYLVPDGSAGRQAALMVSIGDIIGHDMRAAAVMGQVRSMLRQATLGDRKHSPAAALAAVDSTFAVLPLGPGGTAVHARLDPCGDRWRLTWSNAGHTPPLLRLPGGRVSALQEHDLLLLGTPAGSPRRDHTRELPPGSVLMLYTDGLVEHRDSDIDDGIAQAVSMLSAHGDRPLPELLDALSRGLEDFPRPDDVAVLALRVTGPPDDAPTRGPGPDYSARP
ncbi:MULTISPECIES: SpoIIE family protein phosphatase [unclassified Streptomyces]|uniref:GAF domain-containing SpoIIE family protein phosphatase n=1 Tax=unclassified Streptomyces TaxID=2593676 RepID=UPI0001C18961|nr:MULTISPECIES: SpoIIE family protein phosphatase [unclassified Streptomyces]MYR66530.1 SpoIIE family protein phosphatase [Streptomyces sp. SID4939]MYS04590.1 SpoIIE family protein phosphatase [Streptomyces sp. SID4940]MYT61834.1 SpoIIE family protein phosphatase [Streptomyces sp. SID8357]MYT85204.1 SpoIIE family protein phosphatase [Streptomyces sp. SID8360]MYW39101.1 SpoIIE family protein phosphatase [Streptomyces sp. SID1]